MEDLDFIHMSKWLHEKLPKIFNIDDIHKEIVQYTVAWSPSPVTYSGSGLNYQDIADTLRELDILVPIGKREWFFRLTQNTKVKIWSLDISKLETRT